MQKETEFRGEPIEFVESLKVKEGVICDVYKFKEDDTKDLGIVEVRKGFKTPLQLVVGGDRTLEIFKQGEGTLTIIDRDNNQKIYSFPGESQTEIEVRVGEKMQWEALGDLIFAEICYPPYVDGRYKNIDDV